MDIVNEIERALALYSNDGKRPTRLRLGHRQLQAFDSKYRPFVSGVASPGPARAYDDIPVVATESEDELVAE